ncbi:redoxin domain-containing protein [Altererythrobacter marinus]|uniref:Redoxin domain-containing protein n=1 Tax=Pelagerythrobacter marinus TaxID=538382 RepID=A0ABW9UUT4_9SPHN|nr:peroxiredoxin [Pelagerythrobacter marinus]MXO68621.1 redoxin domain-containing protein [Pelagerythrobacter marinus]
MTLSIGSTAPNFTAQTTQGSIHFHDWMGDSWAILFSHPKAFTPVCTTELGYMAGLGEEFAKRDTKILGLSVDSSQDNRDWLPDIEEVSGNKIDYPVVGDSDLQVAKLYNMLPADEAGNAEGRTAADNATVRAVYIIGPDKKIRAMLLYPMSSGRNFDEVLRLLDSVQLTERKGVATPVNWQKGDDVIIPPSLSDEDAKAKYPDGWDEKKPYLRVIQEPID